MISISEQIKKEINPQLQRDIGNTLLKGLSTAMASTPVDTGQMRASWTIGIKQSSYPEYEKPKHHNHGVDIYASRKNMDLSNGKRFVNSLDWFNMKYQTIYISNGMSYSSYVDGKFSIIPKILASLRM